MGRGRKNDSPASPVRPMVESRDGPEGGNVVEGGAKSHLRAEVVAEPSFSNLDQSAKIRNLMRRISRLHSDLDKEKDPGAVLGKIFEDVGELDSFGRIIIDGSIENQLARLDPERQNKLEWLSEVYPKIKKELDGFSLSGKSSAEHMFSLLVTNASRSGIDIYSEIGKIGDSSVRDSMVEGILPQLMIQNGDSYQEDLGRLKPSVRDRVYQNVMIGSAADQMYKNESLEIYLDGLGLPGVHNEIVDKWFGEPAWFWKNSKEISSKVAEAPMGERRDMVIRKIIDITKRSDSESARLWLPLISSRELAETLSDEIGNDHNR